MSPLDTLLTQISNLTRDIETNYPEVYNYLGENPDTIPNLEHPKMDKEVLRDYLDNLKLLVKKYNEGHPLS